VNRYRCCCSGTLWNRWAKIYKLHYGNVCADWVGECYKQLISS